MIHYSCDRCRCPIAQQSVRYVVKMEIEATIDVSHETVEDVDQDGLLAMDEVLEKLEEEVLDEDCTVLYQRKAFDLCPACYRKFVSNPMGRENVIPFGFSHN